jgi:hypothetical protein
VPAQLLGRPDRLISDRLSGCPIVVRLPHRLAQLLRRGLHLCLCHLDPIPGKVSPVSSGSLCCQIPFGTISPGPLRRYGLLSPIRSSIRLGELRQRAISQGDGNVRPFVGLVRLVLGTLSTRDCRSQASIENDAVRRTVRLPVPGIVPPPIRRTVRLPLTFALRPGEGDKGADMPVVVPLTPASHADGSV